MAAHKLCSRCEFSSAFWSVNSSSQQALVDILDGGQPDVQPAGLSCPMFWFPIIGNIMNRGFALNRALGSCESCSGASFLTRGQSHCKWASGVPSSQIWPWVLSLFAKTSANSFTSFYWLWCNLVLVGRCPAASCWKRRYEPLPKTVQHICDHDGSIAVGGHLTIFYTQLPILHLRKVFFSPPRILWT